MKQIIIVSLLFLMGSVGLYAQDYEADLKLMYESYSKMDKYYTEMSIKAFESSKDQTPSFLKAGTICKSGSQFFYDFDDMQILVNKKFSILVQKEEQTIVCKPLDKRTVKNLENLVSTEDLSKVMNAYKSVKYVGLSGSSKHYVIYPKHTFEKVELFIKPNGLITKIIYEYENGDSGMKKMVAEFKNSTLKPDFSKSKFSEEQMFIKKGKTYTAVGKYKKYKVLKVEDYEG